MVMSKQLLLLYAYDDNNELVHIDNAQKGEKYTCPTCGAELILRKSKIPEGQKYYRKSHFAHKGNSDNHCSESFLHKLFKEKCAEYINEKILSQEDILFEWECEKCGEEHKSNLLTNVVRVTTEHYLGICKPDIALLNSEGNVVSVIEVVVTHKPELKTLQYYEDNKITCLQVNLFDFSDCDKIKNILHYPSKVNLCINPICEKCGTIMHNAKIVTVKDNCWRCDKEMTVAFLLAVHKVLSPAYFNEEELTIAKTLGANIQKRYSKTSNENYYANVCPHCNAILGDFFIHDSAFLPHVNEIDLDFKCFRCFKETLALEKKTKEDEYNKNIKLLMNVQTNKICPKCNNTLKLRLSAYGPFWGCENFPHCKHTENINDNEIEEMLKQYSII